MADACHPHFFRRLEALAAQIPGAAAALQPILEAGAAYHSLTVSASPAT